MISIIFAVTAATHDALIEELWQAGTTGIIERDTTLEAFFDDDQATKLQHLNPINITQTDDIDWEQYTKDSFPAVSVGTKFFLAPPWSELETPPHRIRLVITPGLACGTGYHPCTRLCLEALERHLKPGMKILDVGAGSGILSVAATHLNAHPIACDIDPAALPYTEAQHKFTGSVDAIKSQSFDAIVANISAATNTALWPEYQRTLHPHGILILSGYEDDQFTPPIPPLDHLEQDGWHCHVFERPQ
jgi:ribosomal protein L11 methyltransferase